ncbi:hypothetical protein FVF58_46870 [Paraburkholderia panacisoli]|uniref:Uncharacterized protein n=1 Tax=Paraburkholderia panacisoli TaxID=2603818 RepID=A0A5B0G7K1_9BURK|nr:hypothetical protein [Paraburkholderia panacisoli]KAA0997909.1 hypothetical protein FVF58_46870 [Paraburkholderia panacisoli]
MEKAAKAMYRSQISFEKNEPLPEEDELALLESVDALSQKIYPATPESLEIAYLMSAAPERLSGRQQQIKGKIKNLISLWIYMTLCSLALVFIMATLNGLKPESLPKDLVSFISAASFAESIFLGFMGACVYILRSILQGLATQTYRLRDGHTYTLRAILGAVLGYMSVGLFPSNKFISATVLPFLAGYAVEAMFGALDNIVHTIKAAVSRSSTGGDSKIK